MKKNFFINQDENGVAAVELALVLPILLLLVFGIIEFSLILYNQAMITNASREGARAGIVFNFEPDADSLTKAEIKQIVLDYLDDDLITFGESSPVEVDAQGTQGESGSELIVDVSYQYDFLVLPAFADSLAGPLNLTARTVMRME